MGISRFEALSQKTAAMRADQAGSAREVARLREAVSVSLTDPTLKKLESLGSEGQREMFQEGLFRLALDCKTTSEGSFAYLIFNYLKAESSGKIRHQAERELEGMAGTGAAGLRAEMMLSRFADHAADYRNIVPMIAGSLVGQTLGTALLGRLSGAAHATLLTRGLGARTLAGSAALVAEVPVFTLSSRLLHGGGQDSLARDFVRAGLSLAVFKLAGRLGTPGLFGGILGAQYLETRAGLRPGSDFGTAVVDALGTMASLSVGAHLGRRILGPGWAKLQKEIELRSNSGMINPLPFANEASGWGRTLQPARLAPNPLPAKQGGILRPQPFMMSASDPSSGGSGQVPIVDLQPPPSGRFVLGDVMGIKEALGQAEGDPQKLLPLITSLMRVAFHPVLPAEVRNEAGRLLFNGSYFRVWQELLIDEAGFDLNALANLTVPMVKDVAEKCLGSLEAAVQNKDHLLAARLVGPLVYMVFRTQDTRLQTRLETVLTENPTPLLRLPALIHDYRDLNMPLLRIMQWGRYERLLIFDDLISGDLSRRAFGKALLKRMERAEKESGTKYRVVGRISEILQDPPALQALRVELCPEYCITREGIANQLRSSFSFPLLTLRPNRRTGFFENVATEVHAKAKALPLLKLRDLFIDQGLMIIPEAAPLRLIIPSMSQQVARMVREGRWTKEEAKQIIGGFRRITDLLNQHFLASGRTEQTDFLYFPDPFAN